MIIVTMITILMIVTTNRNQNEYYHNNKYYSIRLITINILMTKSHTHTHISKNIIQKSKRTNK